MPPEKITKKDADQDTEIGILKQTMINITGGLNDLKKEVEDFVDKNDISHEKILEKIDSFIESADSKYAPKSVVWWIFITIGGLALTELVRFILK